MNHRPSLTQQLIEQINAKPISAEDLAQAALFTLDAMANAIAGRRSAPGVILSRWQQNSAQDAGRRAFLLGALTHILEVDDLHRASVVHPGCVVVPAAWAVAEREAASGHALLTAVLRGYEAATRIGMAVGPAHYRIWHNTATCGPFGSGMAAASLLQLDSVATVHALGNAGTQSAGLWQFLETAAMTKHLHAGRAAEAGILAADLARLGYTGPPQILEGAKGFFAATCPDADPDKLLHGIAATSWQLWQTSLKLWPCCRHTHGVIDAALALHAQCDPAAIETVLVETYPAALDVCDRMHPTSDYEAKFSLHHCVAAALTQGQIDFSSFHAQARHSLADLRARVRVEAAEPYASAYPDAWGTAVTLIPKNGASISARCNQAKGDPANPLRQEDIINKAARLLRYGGFPQPDKWIAAILDLANDGPIPRDLFNSPMSVEN